MEDDFLAHYGVLGMKWGVRKKRVSSGSSKSSKSSKEKTSLRKKLDTKLTPERKQQIKKIAKTSAMVAGRIAVASLIGTGGLLAVNEIQRAIKLNNPSPIDGDTMQRIHAITMNNKYKNANETGKKILDNINKNKNYISATENYLNADPFTKFVTDIFSDGKAKKLYTQENLDTFKWAQDLSEQSLEYLRKHWKD